MEIIAPHHTIITNTAMSKEEKVTGRHTPLIGRDSIDSDNGSGYIFKPALQDISLKRFRLRYSTFSDCYYLHWDKTICEALAKMKGLENGTFNMSGVKRVRNNNETAYLTSVINEGGEEEEDDSVFDSDNQTSVLKWKMDFSECGLAVKSILIKARHGGNESHVTFSVDRDDGGAQRKVELGDYLKEIPFLRGSRKVCLTAQVKCCHGNSVRPRLLTSSYSDKDCPLDVIVNLMCPQDESIPFVGEILLGLKYNPKGASESLRDKSDITVDCGLMGGQLQVHLVEGAGLAKENGKKSTKSFLKCSFLPDPNSITAQQTSPTTSAYPTWAKEFIYAGIDKIDLNQGGLELILYDHHLFFSDDVIGGIRLSIPCKRSSRDYEGLQQLKTGTSKSLAYFISPPHSRDNSPGPFPIDRGTSSCDSSSQDINSTFTTTMLNIVSEGDVTLSDMSATITNGRPASFNGSTCSYHSPTDSPGVMRKVPFFSIPRDSPVLSPRFSPSPVLGRRVRSPRHSPKTSKVPVVRKTEFVHDWMDSSGLEISHWQQMIESPGTWIYCWHILRPNITPSNEV